MTRETTSAFELNFHDLVRIAATKGASDIHIEPFESLIRIRARVDGVLQTLQEVRDTRYFERFLLQAKRACRFEMAKHMVPQDSRFQADGIPFDLRASLVPTLFGEKIVLRILERNKKFSLSDYPMPEDAKRVLRQALDKWQGLILVTGPTGSGKTTLLYSALSEIDRTENNVHTLEEPVEYSLEGVVQTPISRRGVRFAEALSSLMRQDPDCILVGEIRDEETAEAAIHAASTGHLVFSTVHANSATESIERLVGFGLSRDLIEANLLYASAQRLVPRNCPHCVANDDDSRELALAVFGEEILTRKGQGCSHCNHTGIKGRVLFFECIAKESAESGEKVLRRHGALKDCALEALKKGDVNAQNACAFD